MKTIKQNLFAIIAFVSAIIGGLLFYASQKNRENAHLKADKDLTKQTERSKVVDDKVKSVQNDIDKLSKDMDSPTKSDDEFWKEYTKDKK
jgi:uncharacterized protein YxeA